MALNNHINFAPFGRWTLLTSRHLCERYVSRKIRAIDKMNNADYKSTLR